MPAPFRFEVPAGSPLFAGHFPGHPILPGIAHLAFARQALSEAAGRDISDIALQEIRSLKLRKPAGPGDALDLLLEGPDGDGTARIELRRGPEIVSLGTVRVGSAEWMRGEAFLGEAPIASADFPPAAELVPHAPPARFVQGVVELSPEGLVCLAEIPSLHPLARNGRVPSFLGLEAAAQAAAILEALGRKDQAPGPRLGYLVGLRDARFGVPHLPADRPMRVEVRLHGSVPPLAMYRVSLGEPGAEIVTGTISTYLLE
jgi:3-hydroxymyristoyl/3-hydroxydecanoyl-(acyl carrier protein) dehydratase